MTSPSSDSPTCLECGGEVPVLEAMGATFPLRWCGPCSLLVFEREQLAEREQATARALERAGATPRLLDYSLESYPADGSAAVQSAREWIALWNAGERHNLWLTGSVGSGKTGLAWGIVRELALDAVTDFYASDPDDRLSAPRSPALFLIWRDLLADLREAISTGDDVAASVYDRAQRVAVLALDDLGAERPTPYALEALASLVESRYGRKLPTIITSNYSNRELAAILGHEDAITGRRIVTRLLEGAVGYAFDGPSRRRSAAEASR